MSQPQQTLQTQPITMKLRQNCSTPTIRVGLEKALLYYGRMGTFGQGLSIWTSWNYWSCWMEAFGGGGCYWMLMLKMELKRVPEPDRRMFRMKSIMWYGFLTF
ncbi:hypothetical protein FGO68_gene1915 [Halteria grandinella]|uniref:Uncharacterized protein n=1 Tax=Halteria grandinella TaxID=5974 RepID=A0A8J8T184_HALGN|nr:hypothetical protein FGO68_gene1915 [Halteria grandinella]